MSYGLSRYSKKIREVDVIARLIEFEAARQGGYVDKFGNTAPKKTGKLIKSFRWQVRKWKPGAKEARIYVRVRVKYWFRAGTQFRTIVKDTVSDTKSKQALAYIFQDLVTK